MVAEVAESFGHRGYRNSWRVPLRTMDVQTIGKGLGFRSVAINRPPQTAVALAIRRTCGGWLSWPNAMRERSWPWPLCLWDWSLPVRGSSSAQRLVQTQWQLDSVQTSPHPASAIRAVGPDAPIRKL